MYNPVVQLKSGGYIVINPTEALVSIDINSGRSTKEHGIEQTALSTNLEAAREIARQLRLRDMAGLVVIDFIDMDHHSNARKVERAMKEALKNDRARIQVGRISSFGLMEMSRQRLRTGVLEASTRVCPHCEGTGLVRTASSSALSALRLIEEEAARGHGSQISLQASQEATIYILNNKRAELAEIEDRYHVRVEVLPNGETEGAKMTVTASGPRPERPAIPEPIVDLDDDDDFEDVEDEAEVEEAEERSEENAREDRNGRRKRRRRGRRGGRNRDREDQGSPSEENAENEAAETSSEAAAGDDEAATDAEPARKPRRARGGRRKTAETDAPAEAETATESEPVIAAEAEQTEAAPAKPKRASRKAKTAEVEVAAEIVEPAEAPAEEKPKSRRKPKAKADDAAESADEVAPAPAKKPRRSSKKTETQEDASTDAGDEDPSGDGPRRGWWQRTFG